jgi:hypothetical protein
MEDRMAFYTEINLLQSPITLEDLELSFWERLQVGEPEALLIFGASAVLTTLAIVVFLKKNNKSERPALNIAIILYAIAMAALYWLLTSGLPLRYRPCEEFSVLLGLVVSIGGIASLGHLEYYIEKIFFKRR